MIRLMSLAAASGAITGSIATLIAGNYTPLIGGIGLLIQIAIGLVIATMAQTRGSNPGPLDWFEKAMIAVTFPALFISWLFIRARERFAR